MTFYQSMNIAKKERILWTWHFLCFNNLGYLSNSSQNCFCSQAFNPCKTLISKNLVSVFFFLVFIYTRVNCSSIQTLTNEISKLSGKLITNPEPYPMLNLPSLVITQWLNTVNKLCASLHLNYVNCSTDWVQYPVRWKLCLLDSLGKNCDLKKYTYRFLIYGFVLICIKVSSYHVHQPFENLTFKSGWSASWWELESTE